MSRRISSGVFGRPPRGLDFQRQYARKPARCQRITVSGLTIFKVSRTPGASPYNPANTRRSMLLKVSRCGDFWRLVVLALQLRETVDGLPKYFRILLQNRVQNVIRFGADAIVYPFDLGAQDFALIEQTQEIVKGKSAVPAD